MANTLPDPDTLDWGSMTKAEFKRNELAYELADEEESKVPYVKPLPLKVVNTAEALAVACAAHRIRKGYQKHTQRFSEAKPTEHSNKEMVKFYFNKKAGQYVDQDFVAFEPTAEDYEQVAEVQKWMKRYVMLGLGDLDDFKKDMIESVSKDTVTVNNLGRVAFVPEFVQRDKHETGLKKEIRIEYRDSQHLGKEKESVELVAKILDKRYSSMWESYNYTAVDTNGNLVSFMNKFEHEIGAMKKIKAKIKSKTKNKLFDANETRLNYVKLYKV
jgi:hypothetical protein